MIRRTKSATRLRALLDELGLSQMAAARFLRRDPRTVRSWALGEAHPPFAEVALLEVMAAHKLSWEDVEMICADDLGPTKP
jgi:DNA-binding transcriptional regulator YiaG